MNNIKIPSRNYHGFSNRKSAGGSTSASSIKCTSGYRDTHKVQVENGKTIYWFDLLKSVDEAADRFLALHCPNRKHIFSA